MKRQLGRAGCALAFGAVLAMAGSGSYAAQGERSLLGVTLLKSSYRDVLKRFGRPDEIQAGGPYVPSEGAPGATRAAAGPMMGGMGKMGGMGGSGGMMGPGLPGMGGAGGPSGGGRKATSSNGFPGRGGTGAAGPRGGGMGGGMPGSSGYPGMGGPGGLPGFGGPPGMSGYPGMGGSAGMPGIGAEGPGMPGMGGPGAAAGGAEANGEQAEYEATWWYHDRTNGLHRSFLFNKDGRVIQVQEYGYDKNHKGGKTRLGVGLGSSLNQVLRTYGWSNDGSNEGRNMIMRYGGEDKIAFQLVNNVVVGITVAVVKDVAPAEAP